MGKRKKAEVIVVDDSEDEATVKKPALVFKASTKPAVAQARTIAASQLSDGQAGLSTS